MTAIDSLHRFALNAPFDREKFTDFMRYFCTDFCPCEPQVLPTIGELTSVTLLGVAERLQVPVFEVHYPNSIRARVSVVKDFVHRLVP